MRKIDFNSFGGFSRNEDILIDTNVLYALIDDNDPWHLTVNDLFENHIFKELKRLYINPCIIVETTHLLTWEKSFKRYSERHPDLKITEHQCIRIERKGIPILREFIKKGILNILEFGEAAILQQLDLYREFGATDAVNVALANEYGINILTVDDRLADKAFVYRNKIPDIDIIYFTTKDHMN